MPYLHMRYGTQWDWEPYNPSYELSPTQFAMGEQKIHIDGPNKYIVVNHGVTNLSVQEDIYSAWKEWGLQLDNSKYEQALTAIGGDPITGTTKVGVTYFLENGWRIKMWEGNHELVVDGNLYTREPGEDPYIAPDGAYSVSVSSTRSNLVDIVSAQASLGPGDLTGISAAVWDRLLVNIITNGSIGVYVQDQLAKIDGVDNANTVAAAVWDVLLSNINTNNSVGEHVKDKLLKKNDFLALND